MADVRQHPSRKQQLMIHRRRIHILVSPSRNGRAKDPEAKWEVACNDGDDDDDDVRPVQG